MSYITFGKFSAILSYYTAFWPLFSVGAFWESRMDAGLWVALWPSLLHFPGFLPLYVLFWVSSDLFLSSFISLYKVQSGKTPLIVFLISVIAFSIFEHFQFCYVLK